MKEGTIFLMVLAIILSITILIFYKVVESITPDIKGNLSVILISSIIITAIIIYTAYNTEDVVRSFMMISVKPLVMLIIIACIIAGFYYGIPAYRDVIIDNAADISNDSVETYLELYEALENENYNYSMGHLIFHFADNETSQIALNMLVEYRNSEDFSMPFSFMVEAESKENVTEYTRIYSSQIISYVNLVEHQFNITIEDFAIVNHYSFSNSNIIGNGDILTVEINNLWYIIPEFISTMPIS